MAAEGLSQLGPGEWGFHVHIGTDLYNTTAEALRGNGRFQAGGKEIVIRLGHPVSQHPGEGGVFQGPAIDYEVAAVVEPGAAATTT